MFLPAILLALSLAPQAADSAVADADFSFIGSVETRADAMQANLVVEPLVEVTREGFSFGTPCRINWPEKGIYFEGGRNLRAADGVVALFGNPNEVMDIGTYDSGEDGSELKTAAALSLYESHERFDSHFQVKILSDWKTGDIRGLSFTWDRDATKRSIFFIAKPISH